MSFLKVRKGEELVVALPITLSCLVKGKKPIKNSYSSSNVNVSCIKIIKQMHTYSFDKILVCFMRIDFSSYTVIEEN